MTFQAVLAEQVKSKARIALQGPAGSGKTYSALVLAQGLLVPGEEVYVIDTERGTSAKYAREWKGFRFHVVPFDPPYTPRRFVEAVEYCEEQGAGVIIIDSLSHEWSGEGGALEIVDASKVKYGNNSYYGWREVTGIHNQMVDAMLRSPAHVIVTMRTKTVYAEVISGGKTTYQKSGTEPIQRQGMDYEFDMVVEIDLGHKAIVTKSRYSKLADAMFNPITVKNGADILEWISTGVEPSPPKKDKKDLLEFGKSIGLDADGIKKALEWGDMEFDADNWDIMCQVLTEFSQQDGEEDE